MKPSQSLFFIGFLLTLGSAGAVEFLPPDATLTQWSYLLALTVAGLAAMFVGASDMRSEYLDSHK